MNLLIHVTSESEAKFLKELIIARASATRDAAMGQMSELAIKADAGRDIRSAATELVKLVGMAERAIELAEAATLVTDAIGVGELPVGQIEPAPLALVPPTGDPVADAITREQSREDEHGISREDDPGREIPSNAGEVAAQQVARARRQGRKLTPEDG